MNTVYALIDPFTNQARYVGVTSLPLQLRFRSHLSGYASMGMKEWIEQLKARRTTPAVVDLETVDDATEADEAERFWIANLRAIGADLLNIRSGGRKNVDKLTLGFTINLGDRHDKLLSKLAEKKGMNRTLILKLALEAFEEKEAARDKELSSH